MSYVTPVFLAACAYSLGMACVSVSKEGTYDHLYDQLLVIKNVRNEALSNAGNNPNKLALVTSHNKKMLTMKTEYLNSGRMITPEESIQEMRKLDKQLKIIQSISPFDLLTKALFGNSRSWRRQNPISL